MHISIHMIFRSVPDSSNLYIIFTDVVFYLEKCPLAKPGDSAG